MNEITTTENSIEVLNLDETIINIVETEQFVKATTLPVKIPTDFYKAFTSDEIMSRVYGLVKEGKYQELEYINADVPGRIKSLFVSNRIRFIIKR